jgi:hypothetical protein
MRAVAKIGGAAAGEFGGFAGDNRGEGGLVNSGGAQHRVIEHEDGRGGVGESAGGQFVVTGKAEFAHDDEIERGAEGAGDFGSDGDPAAWQGEHDRIGKRKGCQPGGKAAAGIGAVGKQHGERPE